VNLQQLKYLCAVVDHGLNVSDAAEALFTSQPGISKQIRQLEDELGLSVFVRQGKRLASLTPAGEIVVATARRAMREVANLKRVADEYRGEDTGTLSIATTHTQARYVLPKVLREFATRYPKVKVVLHQGNPIQVAEQTAKGEVDVGIATEALAAVTRYAIEQHQLTRLFAVPFAYNTASCRVLEKAGYVLEARLRRSAIKDGKTTDQFQYAFIVDDQPPSGTRG